MSHAHFNDSAKLDPALAGKLANTGFIFGGIGLVASLAGAFTQGDEGLKQFYYSWLAAYMAVITLTAGALFFVVLHHLVRASWSTALRRTAENIAANMPLMAVLFLPIVLGMHDIYHWSHHDAVEADPVLKAKSAYLNPTGFIVRAVIYLGLWIAIARFYRKHSVAQDGTGDTAINFKLRWWAPLSTLAFALTISFAAFDWSMSTDPHWFSTIFGVVNFAGGMMSFFAALALICLWYTKNGALTRTLTVDNFHDVGKLMWGFMIFWTYTSFSQYFLIWYGNIPEETVWYQLRQQGGWMGPFMVLIVGHFIAPFWLLMSRHMKRNRTVLAAGATWLLAMHYLDHYVMVMPNLHHHFAFHWLDITCLMAVGGLALGAWARRSSQANIVPVKDPQLNASMEYENAV